MKTRPGGAARASVAENKPNVLVGVVLTKTDFVENLLARHVVSVSASVDITPQPKSGIEVIDQGCDGVGGNVLPAICLGDEVADFVVAIVGGTEEHGADQLALMPDAEEYLTRCCRADDGFGHSLHAGVAADRLVSKTAEVLFVLADELEKRLGVIRGEWSKNGLQIRGDINCHDAFLVHLSAP